MSGSWRLTPRTRGAGGLEVLLQAIATPASTGGRVTIGVTAGEAHLTPMEARAYAQELYRLAALAEGRPPQPDLQPIVPGLVPATWHAPWCQEHDQSFDGCTTATVKLQDGHLVLWAYAPAATGPYVDDYPLDEMTVCISGGTGDGLDGDASCTGRQAYALVDVLLAAARDGATSYVLDASEFLTRETSTIVVTDLGGLAGALIRLVEDITNTAAAAAGLSERQAGAS